jgi:hypothetical protein
VALLTVINSYRTLGDSVSKATYVNYSGVTINDYCIWRTLGDSVSKATYVNYSGVTINDYCIWRTLGDSVSKATYVNNLLGFFIYNSH